MTTSILSPLVVEDKQMHLTEKDINIVNLLSTAHHPKAGAVVLFSGETRENADEKIVHYLNYEAHVSMANKMIASILSEATQRWNLNIAIAQHRIGKVVVSQSAVVVITAASHRSEAYAANRFIIDKIKHEVPIWKCEHFTDGSKKWGGNCNCQLITGNIDSHIYEFDQ